MAALDANPFDDLLSSHSVFVSPLRLEAGSTSHTAADRYGQHADDRYSHAKDFDENESVGPHDLCGDSQWRWSGPADPDDHDVEELFVDPENEFAHATVDPQQLCTRGQDDDAASSPERPPEEDHGEAWEEGEDGELGNRGYDAENIHNANHNFEAQRLHETVGHGITPSVNSVDDDVLVQHDEPSPVAGALGSPSASRSFEDQPIRGLGAGKEMSLDELIAQGERQMQEAQAKNASVKAPGGVSKPARPPAPTAAVVAVSPPRAAPAAAVRRGPVSTDTVHEGAFAGPQKGPPVRHSAETTSAAMGAGGGGSNLRSSVVASLSGRGGGGGGLGASVSMRSASFATSWSGGDPEQLRHLSMGVMPAAGGGDQAARREEESRNERERREFYELEMELLREEERGSEPGSGRQGGGLGGQGQEDDDVGDGERENCMAGGRKEGAGPDNLTSGLGFDAAGASNPGYVLVWGFVTVGCFSIEYCLL